MNKHASYRYGVQWIAENDEASEVLVASIEEQITVAMLADLFGKTAREVAFAVFHYRVKHDPKYRARAKEVKGQLGQVRQRILDQQPHDPAFDMTDQRERELHQLDRVEKEWQRAVRKGLGE